MTNDQSRDIVVSLVLVCAVPIQAVTMWTRETVTGFDWFVLGALVVFGIAHVDAAKRQP